MTGIDKLQAQGLTGAGLKVAVVDSGVDYLLPVLGGGFGKGYKVAQGYDFVGDVSRILLSAVQPCFPQESLQPASSHSAHTHIISVRASPVVLARCQTRTRLTLVTLTALPSQGTM